MEKLYIAVPLSQEDNEMLSLYGFDLSTYEGDKRIPIPLRKASKVNANGYWIVHKGRPKEPRIFERAYHIVDWHGNHHSGTCFQTRMCYQRTLACPKEITFHIENDVFYSPKYTNCDEDMEDIRLAMNITLEMFGHCETWTEEKAPVNPPINQMEVPWEILRAGSKEKEIWKDYVSATTKSLSKSNQTIIKDRHEHLWARNPDFCVLGAQNFFGYVVYGFRDRNIYVFECNSPDNATYVFKGHWEQASRLTKTEILSNKLQEARIFHTQNWKERINKAIGFADKEVA
ncbi:MAG: hypothetical protein GX096_05700 [Clostridiales bacterium]|nr:hypothetical protein [Clostridiales bacterium]